MVAYSFKKRFVTPIRLGLGMEIDMADPEWVPAEIATTLKPKRQTIRAIGKRRHAREGETMQLYCGMRHPSCFLIAESRCVQVSPIRIDVRKNALLIRLGGGLRVRPLPPDQIAAFAQKDGFAGADDMHAFWRSEHGFGTFRGFLIEWEPKP